MVFKPISSRHFQSILLKYFNLLKDRRINILIDKLSLMFVMSVIDADGPRLVASLFEAGFGSDPHPAAQGLKDKLKEVLREYWR